MIKNFLIWFKTNWYFYLLVTLGLSYYLCIIFIRFIRELKFGTIVSENISIFRVYLNILITIIFFILLIVLICMLYKTVKKNTKTSKFSQWILIYTGKITQFYEEVLDKTLLWMILNVFYFSTLIKKLLPYFNRFMRTNLYLKFIIINIIVYSIPIIVSFCFLIDAYNNTYYYFSRIVILLIIPLTINSILYVFKTTALRVAEIWRMNFYVEHNADKITNFLILPESDFSQEFDAYKTNDEKIDRIHSEFHFYETLHQINYSYSFYEQFQLMYKIPLMLSKFIIIMNFFISWLIISYTSLIIY